jgi:hypothetical protein
MVDCLRHTVAENEYTQGGSVLSSPNGARNQLIFGLKMWQYLSQTIQKVEDGSFLPTNSNRESIDADQ